MNNGQCEYLKSQIENIQKRAQLSKKYWRAKAKQLRIQNKHLKRKLVEIQAIRNRNDGSYTI